MFITYNILILFLIITLLPVIVLAFVLVPKFRAGFWQKMGFYPKLAKQNKTIWLHAVSVGEVNAVYDFALELRKKHPEDNIVLSVVTKTGFEIAHKRLSATVNNIIYFPYDFVFSVNSAIKNINPYVVIIAETEIWANFANELNKRKIPLMIINGRISPSSFKGYKKISFFIKKVLGKYSAILMQTEEDKHRIIELGAEGAKTFNMGNLKLDIKKPLTEGEIETLRAELKATNSRIITAASTHKGEDEIILRLFNELKSEFQDLKLILAPRHPERNKAVESLIKKTEICYGKRSLGNDFSNNDIILLDTMGELAKIYSISYLAFVGGSFSDTGGHNPLEATVFDVPTVSGSCVFNFKKIYDYLSSKRASFIVNDEAELYETFKKLLADEDVYKNSSENCNKIFKENSGAVEFAMKKLSQLAR